MGSLVVEALKVCYQLALARTKSMLMDDVDRLVESHNSKLDVYFDWRVRNIDGPGDPFVALRRNVQLVPTGFEVSHIQRRITQESTIKKDLRAGDITCHSEYMG